MPLCSSSKVLPQIFCKPSSGLISGDPGLLIWFLKCFRVWGQVPQSHCKNPFSCFTRSMVSAVALGCFLARWFTSPRVRTGVPCSWRWYFQSSQRDWEQPSSDTFLVSFISPREDSFHEKQRGRASPLRLPWVKGDDASYGEKRNGGAGLRSCWLTFSKRFTNWGAGDVTRASLACVLLCTLKG